MMTLKDIAIFLGENIVIRFPDVSGNYMADFEDCEIRDDCFLISKCGRGKTPIEAMRNYADNIRGKQIVFHSMRMERKEFVIPNDIEVGE